MDNKTTRMKNVSAAATLPAQSLKSKLLSVVACTLLGGAAFGDVITITDVEGGSLFRNAPDLSAQAFYDSEGHQYRLIGSGKSDFESRPVIQFDTSAFTADVSYITGVTLRTYVPATSGDPLTFTIYAITQAWDPTTATWNTLNDKYNSATPIGTATQTFDGTLHALDVTLNSAGVSLVTSWITTPSTNYGLMILSANGWETPDSIIGSATNQPSLLIAVPEPMTLSVIGLGLGALLLSRKEKRA